MDTIYGPQQGGLSLVQDPGTFSSGNSGSNWWNQNGTSVLGFGTQLINGFLQFGANMAAINADQPAPYQPSGNNGNTNTANNTGAQQQQQQPNYLVWVIVIVFIVLVLLSAALIFKSNSGK